MKCAAVQRGLAEADKRILETKTVGLSLLADLKNGPLGTSSAKSLLDFVKMTPSFKNGQAGTVPITC